MSIDDDQNRRAPAAEREQPDSVVVTASERVLAWILAGFLLIALSWAYVNIDDAVRDARSGPTDAGHRTLDKLRADQERSERSLGLWDDLSAGALERARAENGLAEVDRDAKRERYRTELDAGNSDKELRSDYLAAEARAAVTKRTLVKLDAARATALKKQADYMKSKSAERRAAERRVASRRDATDRWIFLLRALLMAGALALSVLLLRRVADRSPRSQPLAQATVVASGLMVLTMIIDYGEISFDFDSLGPLGLSALGAAITIAAFFGLQRYLAKRRPLRRLRAGECRLCGYPVKDVDFCEGCGARVLEDCHRCGRPRRVGTPHCRACGAT